MMLPRMLVLMAATAPLLAAAPLRAQTTEDNLKRAVDMYQAFNIEGARPILLNIISPNYLLSVTNEQKVKAFKYLGASYAVLDRRDSAVTFFSAAIDRDPFTDLDPREFSAAELAAFNEAKTKIFKVAVRPVEPQRLDSNFVFRLISTQRANLIVEVIKQADTTQKEALFQGDNDGPREIPWNGLLRNGQRADSTFYDLRVRARQPGANAETVERQLFKIEHVFEPLEDTLPSIAQSDLLPEQYPQSSPWRDLIKGSSLALTAVALPLLALDNNVRWVPHAGVAATVGLASGVISFSYRRAHRAIPANVRENTRRQQQRAIFNAGVRARNAERIGRTIMLICPATGCPR
ncbi:MAG TPA: hypothetical protein VJ867_17170 [Gemmatimonadaceae bacterium]|nr:hypothetical protein [Gemmatimonadaceae bacterium]